MIYLDSAATSFICWSVGSNGNISSANVANPSISIGCQIRIPAFT